LVRKAQRNDDELAGKVGGLLIGCPRTAVGLNVEVIYLFILGLGQWLSTGVPCAFDKRAARL
jgi:hypothetical protein